MTRDDVNRRATANGHDMVWKLGENATRKGYCYFFVGTCNNCGGSATAGASWSSSRSHVDARHAICGGKGTAILTEIEAERIGEKVNEAVAEFGAAVRAVIRDSTAPWN